MSKTYAGEGVNRQYKSSLFAALFSDREELLKLYNAVNGTHYTDPELLGSCKTLKDYSEYTARVRKYAQKKNTTTREAVERAIQECIQEGILSEYLSRNRAEAIKMSIYEYDEEKHMRQEREEWWQKGIEAGRSEGRREAILDILSEFGDIPAELKETITAQEDPDILKKWIRAAVQSASVEEFVRKTAE